MDRDEYLNRVFADILNILAPPSKLKPKDDNADVRYDRNAESDDDNEPKFI